MKCERVTRSHSLARQRLDGELGPLPWREARGKEVEDRARVLDKSIGRIDHDEPAGVETQRVAASSDTRTRTSDLSCDEAKARATTGSDVENTDVALTVRTSFSRRLRMQAKKSAHHMPDSRSDCSTPISVFDAIPKDAEDADARADRFVDEDPFHKILPALLSSEHVKKYIKQIGMLYPYDIENADNFKAASCEIEMGGTYIRWNEDKSIVEKNIVPLVPYVFPANSITYVQIKPIIRLPNYIAMRFNLRIKHVHRGLLLGTGPLVDPGYRGNLVIPIHNLTASDYVIYGGDKLIWAEFTKTSYIKEDSNINSKFVPTQKRIFNQPPKYWLDKAAGKNVPIQNSIPAALAVAIKSAEESKAAAKGSLDAAEEARKWAQRWVLGSALGALLASVGMVIALHQLFHQVDGNIMQAVSAVNASTSISNAARESIDNTDKSVKSATSSLDRIEHDLDSTRKVAEEQATRIRLLEQELCKAGIGPKCKKD